jgi:hypothetical protein
MKIEIISTNVEQLHNHQSLVNDFLKRPEYTPIKTESLIDLNNEVIITIITYTKN